MTKYLILHFAFFKKKNGIFTFAKQKKLAIYGSLKSKRNHTYIAFSPNMKCVRVCEFSLEIYRIPLIQRLPRDPAQHKFEDPKSNNPLPPPMPP